MLVTFPELGKPDFERFLFKAENQILHKWVFAFQSNEKFEKVKVF